VAISSQGLPLRDNHARYDPAVHTCSRWERQPQTFVGGIPSRHGLAAHNCSSTMVYRSCPCLAYPDRKSAAEMRTPPNTLACFSKGSPLRSGPSLCNCNTGRSRHRVLTSSRSSRLTVKVSFATSALEMGCNCLTTCPPCTHHFFSYRYGYHQ